MGEFKGLLERLEKLGLKSSRPWGEFLGGLRVPSRKWRKEEVEEKMKANLVGFKANYLILLAGVMSFSIISNPFTMGVVLVCLALSAVILGWKGPLEVLGRPLTPRDRLAVAGALSLFFLVLSGALAKLLLTFTFGLTLTLAHMVLYRRHPGSKAKNQELGISQSNKQDSALEDIESPAVTEAEESTEGVGSYQKEASLRASSRSSAAAVAAGGSGKTSPRGA